MIKRCHQDELFFFGVLVRFGSGRLSSHMQQGLMDDLGFPAELVVETPAGSYLRQGTFGDGSWGWGKGKERGLISFLCLQSRSGVSYSFSLFEPLLPPARGKSSFFNRQLQPNQKLCNSEKELFWEIIFLDSVMRMWGENPNVGMLGEGMTRLIFSIF